MASMDSVHGRSSDVVAMEGMSSRYGVGGPDDMVDGRYLPVNGRDGYMGRMGHPVAVDNAFRQGYSQRQMEQAYDRPVYNAAQATHFQHPAYFNHHHQSQQSYQYQHQHLSHAPSYHGQVHSVNTRSTVEVISNDYDKRPAVARGNRPYYSTACACLRLDILFRLLCKYRDRSTTTLGLIGVGK